MNIVFTKNAKDDINDILFHISHVLSNPTAALKLLNEIEKAILKLEQFPELYPQVIDPILNKKGYRKIVVDNYIIFYIIQKEQVVIMRALYGAVNFVDIL